MSNPFFLDDTLLINESFFIFLETQNHQITDTRRRSCPVNEFPVLCQPCENFCNEEPRVCITVITHEFYLYYYFFFYRYPFFSFQVCRPGIFCTCKNGYSRVSRNTSICVPNEWCYLFAEKNCTATTTTTESATTATSTSELPRTVY